MKKTTQVRLVGVLCILIALSLVPAAFGQSCEHCGHATTLLENSKKNSAEALRLFAYYAGQIIVPPGHESTLTAYPALIDQYEEKVDGALALLVDPVSCEDIIDAHRLLWQPWNTSEPTSAEKKAVDADYIQKVFVLWDESCGAPRCSVGTWFLMSIEVNRFWKKVGMASGHLFDAIRTEGCN